MLEYISLSFVLMQFKALYSMEIEMRKIVLTVVNHFDYMLPYNSGILADRLLKCRCEITDPQRVTTIKKLLDNLPSVLHILYSFMNLY